MEDNGTDLVKISLNMGGNDYHITVDMETAQALLNDQHLVELYVRQAFPDEFPEPDKSDDLFDIRGSEENVNLNLVEGCNEENTHLKKVWFSKGKPSVDDEDATLYFLKLREKYAPKFDDRRTVKNKLWAAIAQDMKAAGYDIVSSKGAAAKCKQKFMNLESKYLKHIEHIKSTGSHYKDAPPYFDLLHSILNHKHKVNPESLQDSETKTHAENEPSTSASIMNNSEIEQSQSDIKNRFKSAITIKPKVNKSDKIVEELKRQFDIDQSYRKECLSEIKEQNNQRKQMIDLLIELVGKRKRMSDL